MDSAASTFPAATSRRLVSTSRARNGTAPIVSGTMAAVDPIVVPTIPRVTGATSTSRMMKGSARPRLTTSPRTRFSGGRGASPPGAVTVSSTPSGTPSSTVTSAATPTM
jgi:hypothetical protein